MYKGIIFNSVTVRALKGALADAVRERHIRTAVVSTHRKGDVQAALETAGIEVDVVVGGYDLSRFGQHRKPDPDTMFIAAAKMDLEPTDVLSVVDCTRDRKASEAAGMDMVEYDQSGMDSIIPMLAICSEPEAPRNFGGIQAPVTGIMGVVVGDTVGSMYEHHRTTDYNFPLFPPRSKPTDDSVETLAIARWLMGERTGDNLVRSIVNLCNRYPKAGYSHYFSHWLRSLDRRPYGGFTNGSAMRVAPCGWAAQSLQEALDLARQTAEVSHNSDEGVRGAQAVAAAIYLARIGQAKEDIGRYVAETFRYDFSPSIDEIRLTADHSYRCDVSIPQAFCCWLQSETYEETVRNSVSLATDSDTIAAIAGGMAAATPGMEIPGSWADRVFGMLKPDLKSILVDFDERYCRG